MIRVLADTWQIMAWMVRHPIAAGDEWRRVALIGVALNVAILLLMALA